MILCHRNSLLCTRIDVRKRGFRKLVYGKLYMTVVGRSADFSAPQATQAVLLAGRLCRQCSTLGTGASAPHNPFKARVLFGRSSCLLNTADTLCRKQPGRTRRGGHPCPTEEGEIHLASAHLRMSTKVRNWGSVSQTIMACCHAIRSKISKLGM